MHPMHDGADRPGGLSGGREERRPYILFRCKKTLISKQKRTRFLKNWSVLVLKQKNHTNNIRMLRLILLISWNFKKAAGDMAYSVL